MSKEDYELIRQAAVKDHGDSDTPLNVAGWMRSKLLAAARRTIGKASTTPPDAKS